MFNVFVIFLPLFVVLVLSLFLAMELLDERNRYVLCTKACLLAFVLTCVFLYLGHATYFMLMYDSIPLTDSLYCFCSPAVYPLYYIYLCELCNSRRHWYSEMGWLVAPVLCGVAVSTCYLLMSTDEQHEFVMTYLYENRTDGLSGFALFSAYAHGAVKWVFGLQILPIAILGSRKINLYNELVSRSYADVNQYNLVMLRLMFVLFLVSTFLSAVSNVFGRYRFVDDPTLLAFPSTMFALLIFIQVYIGIRYKYPTIAAEDSSKEPVVELAETSKQPSDKEQQARKEAAERIHELCRRIEVLMDQEKVFLQNGLKISDLAELLCCNRNYIYRAINVEMGTSFAEYINKKRVDYAKKMIEQKPDLQMNELYMRVGFSSSSSFYRCFRQFEGCTPKELQERLRKKE